MTVIHVIYVNLYLYFSSVPFSTVPISVWVALAFTSTSTLQNCC